jgi:hypothetical protein
MRQTGVTRISQRQLNIPIIFLGVFALLLYSAYILFVASTGQGGVDYETFMDIGERYNAGQAIWTENSYYPMPYVMVFGIFSALPRTMSVFIWHFAPVIVALIISRGRPWPLLFAPLFAHTIGGQTAFFALLGVYVYRENMDHWRGGIGLALLLFKPQLALIPLAWAGFQWLKHMTQKKQIPTQVLVFLGIAFLIYLPGFLLIPDWVTQWLAQPRGVFERALAGIVPRTVLIAVGEASLLYWLWLVTIAAALLCGVWVFVQRRLTFDLVMLWGYVVHPMVHDYDLIQMIPMLDKPVLQWTAVIASIPTWIVIFTAYGVDSAWYAVTLIGPVVLIAKLWVLRQQVVKSQQATNTTVSA